MYSTYKDGLNIMQTELNYYSKNVDMFIVSKTWLNKQEIQDRYKVKFNLNGYDIVREDRLIKKGGGVAILIKNQIQ